MENISERPGFIIAMPADTPEPLLSQLRAEISAIPELQAGSMDRLGADPAVIHQIWVIVRDGVELAGGLASLMTVIEKIRNILGARAGEARIILPTREEVNLVEAPSRLRNIR